MATKTAKKTRHRGRTRAKHLSRPDVPYTMKLPDGRTLFVEVPGRWTVEDRGGEVAFLPEGVRFLDRIRALAMKLDRAPSPGYVTALREAMGLTQAEIGKRIGVDKMTVSRWERGTLRPSDESLSALERLRKNAIAKGIVIPG